MKKSVVVLLQVAYWFMYLLLIAMFFLLIAMSNAAVGRVTPNLIMEFGRFMLGMAIIPGVIGFYLSYIYLFPKFYVTRRIGKLFLMSLPLMLCCSFGGFVALLAVSNGPAAHNIGMQYLFIVPPLAFIGLVNGVLGLVMRGFITSYSDIILKEELNKKNYEMELELIKSQLDPHFLFNTLNNIDVLIELDAPKASLYLNKLSDIMRFMLYETKQDKLPLSTELKYIEKYIELQRIRIVNPDFVSFQVDGDPSTWEIEPMLFIPFIENAFKHAANKHAELGIDIYIKIEADLLTFECANSCQYKNELSETGGLGNELIAKRLQLLYPTSHTLLTEKTNDQYKVNLKITR